MTERVAAYWVGNVAHAKFAVAALHTTPDSAAPVYGMDTPHRWPIPQRLKRWTPRLPIRTEAESEALSAQIKAKVERTIAEREARRQALRAKFSCVENIDHTAESLSESLTNQE